MSKVKSIVNPISHYSKKEQKGKLHHEYYALHDQYREKFGENVAILMQVGKFFEMYAPADLSRSSNIREIASLLNCNLTWKEKERMSGFPLVSLEKNVKKLTDNNYTVVVIEQKGNTTGKREDRVITEVLSKSTILDNTRLRNNIMSIYYRKFSKGVFSFGISVVDTNISKEIIVHELHSSIDDKGFALDAAIRFVTQYEPVECIITTKNGDLTDDIQRHLGLRCPVFNRDVQSIDEEHLCNETGYSDCILYSLGSLRMFFKDHKLNDLDYKVVQFNSQEHLDLCSTAIKQLDLPMLLSRSNGINMTVTAMGNRLLTERVYMPLKDKSELETRYDAIESMSEARCKSLREKLREMPDLDKTHKRLSVGQLTWGQFRTLHETYTTVPLLLENSEISKSVEKLIKDYKGVVKGSLLEKGLQTANLTEDIQSDAGEDADESTVDEDEDDGVKLENKENIFVDGVYKDLDEMYAKRKESYTFVNNLINDAVKCLNSKKPIKFPIKDAIGLKTTQKRAELLQSKMGFKIVKLQKTILVYTEELRNHLGILISLEEEITRATGKYFTSFQIRLHQENAKLLSGLSKAIAELDFQQCAYSMAKRFRLTRPHIAKEKGIFQLRNVRHLLIEIINGDVKYIPNDCIMGTGTDQYGMLLYGVNSCGKTSFLKSVGLAVVMAQAGLFVPAESMLFTPLSKIMTRIAGSDNMERSQSSFIVELEELLSMVRRSDDETLILGDEMCRGTEVESANAIVYTTLQWLMERKSLFIAATHLHNIARKVENEMPLVKIFHMKVAFDKDGNVVYDRKLAPGPGQLRYGLEIARAMSFPERFLRNAFAFREWSSTKETKEKLSDEMEVLQQPIATVPTQRKSRYNAKKVLVKCENCGYVPKDVRCLPLDTHHIEFQCNTDGEGYHGTQHKNALHNLVAVCKECHCKIHKGLLNVTTIQGLKGTKVIFKDSLVEEMNPITVTT